MGVRHLEMRQPHRTDTVPSYAGILGIARTQTKHDIARSLDRAYTIPLKRNDDEVYVTVELEYRGDFSDRKDPHSYVLASLGLE